MSRKCGQRVTVLAALSVLCCATGLCAAAETSGSTDALVLKAGDTTLEITAPRADIVRVRMGHPNLPENASWAVEAAPRGARTPMKSQRDGNITRLDTGALAVEVDASTLQVSILDANGKPLLQDAGAGVAFNSGGFALTKSAPEGVHYFGLGDKAGTLDRRGGLYTLWNTDAYGYSSAADPLYKSIPFFIGADADGRSFGFFLDNTWRSNFDFGKRDSHKLVVEAAGGPIDYYVMAGPDPRAVVQQYAWLTGAAPLAPLWSLGFQQSHWSYKTQDIAQGIADRLRADRVPADVLYLDIDYQDRNRPFTVNTQAFPDLKQFVARLRGQGLRLVLITDLHIADAPDQGYAPYDTGKAADLFLKTPAGADYVGKVWPGDAVFPDFSRAQARAWWGEQYAGFVKLGVSGFWNDMNEPAIFDVPGKTMPLDVVHAIDEPGFAARKASHAEMHNVYGMLNSRATFEGLMKLAPDERPFVLTRASYAGGQRYAATWTGDNTSSWEHLHLSINMLANLGLSGFAYSGDDIGGFAGRQPSADLLTRWIEVGAFNPIFRDHYDNAKAAQEVWVDGPEHEAIRRRFIEERYRLMPYIYGLAEENSRTGLPILRPVFLEFPATVGSDWGNSGQGSQFMLGDELLIAPPEVWESPAPYKITLPGSGWFDYWTGQRLASAQLSVTPRLDHLPVFVRPGAILVMQPLVQSTSEMPRGPLSLHVYPGEHCAGHVYLDDGVSLAYQRGEYLRQAFSCASGAASSAPSLDIAFAQREGRYAPWWQQISIIVHGWTGGAAARLNGKTVHGDVDAASGTLTVVIPDQPRAATLRIGH
ncbi:MAG: TIM-barrel domain-containing protein [Steroidobacteraceae bacterium]